MTQAIEKPFTYEDYLALPDDGNRYEVIEGVLYVTPAPNIGHQSISYELSFLMGLYVKQNKLGKVYYAPFEVHLSELTRPVQPDILFIRMENVPPVDATPAFKGVPDLVVEILSPATSRADLTVKFSLYERAGIKEYWIVDPKAHSVKVFALEESQYALHGEYIENEVITSRVLKGLEIVNSEIFE